MAVAREEDEDKVEAVEGEVVGLVDGEPALVQVVGGDSEVAEEGQEAAGVDGQTTVAMVNLSTAAREGDRLNSVERDQNSAVVEAAGEEHHEEVGEEAPTTTVEVVDPEEGSAVVAVELVVQAGVVCREGMASEETEAADRAVDRITPHTEVETEVVGVQAEVGDGAQGVEVVAGAQAEVGDGVQGVVEVEGGVQGVVEMGGGVQAEEGEGAQAEEGDVAQAEEGDGALAMVRMEMGMEVGSLGLEDSDKVEGLDPKEGIFPIKVVQVPEGSPQEEVEATEVIRAVAQADRLVVQGLVQEVVSVEAPKREPPAAVPEAALDREASLVVLVEVLVMLVVLSSRVNQ